MSNTTDTAAAVYLAFVASMKAKCDGLPIQVRELKNFVCFESTQNQHKFYVPKSATQMGPCETTIPGLLDAKAPGAAPLPKGPGSNGKIEARFVADLKLIEQEILPRLIATEDSLRANKRPARKATPSTGAPTVEATPSIHLGSTDEELFSE